MEGMQAESTVGREPVEFFEQLIDEGEAAKFLGLSRRTLQAFRLRGNGPRFFRLSARAVRFRRRDLRDWAEARAAQSTAEYAA